MTVTTICAAIAAERQAQIEADERNDADAWLGCTEAINSLLDDLLALQRVTVDRGVAPQLA